MTSGLRLILFDATCAKLGFGLSRVWYGGSFLYRALGRSDAAHGARTFDDGLRWLTTYRAEEPIAEIQFWGHGKWGRVFIAREPIDRTALVRDHRHHTALLRVRERLTKDALVWFRSCETFGAAVGQDFARAWTEFFGCRAAGHTFVIGYWQSGLHLLAPGVAPHWAADEGLIEGSANEPRRAAWSHPGKPNTITCFGGHVPARW